MSFLPVFLAKITITRFVTRLGDVSMVASKHSSPGSSSFIACGSSTFAFSNISMSPRASTSPKISSSQGR